MFLNLEALKQALEHDRAAKGFVPPVADIPAARRLLLDARSCLEAAAEALERRPYSDSASAEVAEEAEACIGKVREALGALRRWCPRCSGSPKTDPSTSTDFCLCEDAQ